MDRPGGSHFSNNVGTFVLYNVRVKLSLKWDPPGRKLCSGSAGTLTACLLARQLAVDPPVHARLATPHNSEDADATAVSNFITGAPGEVAAEPATGREGMEQYQQVAAAAHLPCAAAGDLAEVGGGSDGHLPYSGCNGGGIIGGTAPPPRSSSRLRVAAVAVVHNVKSK